MRSDNNELIFASDVLKIFPTLDERVLCDSRSPLNFQRFPEEKRYGSLGKLSRMSRGAFQREKHENT